MKIPRYLMDFSVILIIHSEDIFFNSKAPILLTYLFTCLLYTSRAAERSRTHRGETYRNARLRDKREAEVVADKVVFLCYETAEELSLIHI